MKRRKIKEKVEFREKRIVLLINDLIFIKLYTKTWKLFQFVCVSLSAGLNPEECTPRQGQHLQRTACEAGQLSIVITE